MAILTLSEHGDHFEAHVLLHAQLTPLQHHGYVGYSLDHETDVLAQLVQRERPAHHGSQARLQCD